MLLWWIQPFCKSYPYTFSTLVFHLTAAFLLLTHCCEGQSLMVGSSGRVLAMLGEDTILPCHLKPATDVTAKTLEWAKSDLNPRFVHLWRDGVEIPVNQHPSYVGRTFLSTDKLKQGDISLKLMNVKLSDEGEYRCHIPEVATTLVQLAVGAASCSVVIKMEVDKTTSRLVLKCESAGWYPEPEVFWLDGKENLLSVGPTEALRGPDGLYTVSSKVTLEKRDNNKFLCRVQQKTINLTRSTEIQIPEDEFMDPTCSAVRILIVVVLSLGFILTSASLFVLWKLGQRKMNNKKQPDTETEGTAEKEQLVEESLISKNLDEEMAKLDESLKDKTEEKEIILHVLEALTVQKIELVNFRHEQESQQENMEKEYMKNEKKLKALEAKYKWDKGDKKIQLLEVKMELEARRTKYEIALKNNKDRLEKVEDRITAIIGFKEKLDNQIQLVKSQLEETQRQNAEEAQQSSI